MKRGTQYVPVFYKQEMAKNKVVIFSLTSISSLEIKKQQKMQLKSPFEM